MSFQASRFGGSWWIRTTEALSSRFTVCPHWPLGKAPIFYFCSVAALRVAQCLIIIAKRNRKCKPFFKFFCDFFKKVFFARCIVHFFKKKERPAGVRRGAPRGISEDRRRIMYICNGIVALLVVWPGPSDCSGMAQGTVCMIAGCFPRLSFDYDT